MVSPALRRAFENPVFEVSRSPYVVLDTELVIRAANRAFLDVTGSRADELVGAFVFDAFPDNPHDAGASGVRNLGASYERVLRRGVPDDMGVQRYDIPTGDVPGGFREKIWAPVNSPLLDDRGRVIGVLHHVEDITRIQGPVPDDGPAQPAAVVRHSMISALRFSRALDHAYARIDQLRSVQRRSVPWAGERGRADVLAGSVERDRLWHGIVHAARTGRPGNCAAAVCEAAVDALPGIDAAAVTLRSATLSQHHLAASHEWARHAEELQLIAGEGPSLTAFSSGDPSTFADPGTAGAVWPAFTDAAARHGIGAAFAFPLRTADDAFGTLTLYRRAEPSTPPGVTTAAGGGAPAQEVVENLLQVSTGMVFAEMATVVLLADTTSEIVPLITADPAHDDIDVAAGMLAARERCSVADALARLRAAAYAGDRRLIDVAREVVARRDDLADPF